MKENPRELPSLPSVSNINVMFNKVPPLRLPKAALFEDHEMSPKSTNNSPVLNSIKNFNPVSLFDEQELSPKSINHGPVKDSSVEFFLDKLEYTIPGISSTPARLHTGTVEQRQFDRILHHFQENITSSHEKDKYVQVDALFGIEQRLAQFSKELEGSLDVAPSNDERLSRRFIEWPVCGKYPNCYICTIEICGIVSVLRENYFFHSKTR